MHGDILVINTGSSSLKYATFAADPSKRTSGTVDGIGAPHGSAKNHIDALSTVVEQLQSKATDWRPAAIGHRIVHGGSQFTAPTVLDAAARTALKELIPLDPLHPLPNPQGVDAAVQAFPAAVQVACFDTAFHRNHAWVADTYALPREFHAAGVRRYGFHGLSYESIVGPLRRLAPKPAAGRVVVAHLGNGASPRAIRDGQSVESTMGFSVLDGAPMGTRCGQLDPGVALYPLRERRMSAEQIEELPYKKSGLLGLSGASSDMRDLLTSDRPEARQAVEYFVHRATGAIASLAAALNGVDGIVFTGGIGEHAADVRTRILRGLGWPGVDMDDTARGPRLPRPGSPAQARVAATDEEGTIARHVRDLIPKP